MKDRDFDELIAARILGSISALTLHEQEEAIQRLIGSALTIMKPEVIREMRDEIIQQFPAQSPLVQKVINMIDGQLALREIRDQGSVVLTLVGDVAHAVALVLCHNVSLRWTDGAKGNGPYLPIEVEKHIIGRLPPSIDPESWDAELLGVEDQHGEFTCEFRIRPREPGTQ